MAAAAIWMDGWMDGWRRNGRVVVVVSLPFNLPTTITINLSLPAVVWREGGREVASLLSSSAVVVKKS